MERKRLNLGCGDKKRKGCINIDIRGEVNPDVVCDCRDLSAFAANSVEEIIADDILEHFNWFNVRKILQEWIRVLQPGGFLIVKTPDIDKIFRDKEKLVKMKGGDITSRFSALLFGKQDYPENAHKVCFDKKFFLEFLPKKYPIRTVIIDDIPDTYNIKIIMEKIR